MAELITLDSLGPVLDKLRLAFRVRLTERDVVPTVEVWHDGLAGLTIEAVDAAAKRYIQTSEHFPRVKEIRELALEFMARTGGGLVRRAEVNPRACSACGAEYQHHEIEHKRSVTVKLENGHTIHVDRFKPDGSPALDGKGQPIFERIVSPREDIIHVRSAHIREGYAP